MAYKIYRQKLLEVIAEQQEDGNYIIMPYTRSKEGNISLLDDNEVMKMPKDVFELNYEGVEDAEG